MSGSTFEVKDTPVKVPGTTADDGIIRKYGQEVGKSYPHIRITCTDLSGYKLMTLKGMLSIGGVDEDGYTVYLTVQGKTLKLGTLPSNSLRALLSEKVFDGFTVEARLSADSEPITGDMLYALCPLVALV